MAFLRDVALVSSVERVVQLTGRTDLRNLETSGELDLADLLVSASNTIHDKLAARGVAPDELRNAWVYENAVAWQFLGVLAESGALGEELAADLFLRAERYFDDVRPELSSGGTSAPAADAPAVLNPTEPPFAWFGRVGREP